MSPGEWYSTGEGVKDCTEPCAEGRRQTVQRQGDELCCVPPQNPESEAFLSHTLGEGMPGLETSELLPDSC